MGQWIIVVFDDEGVPHYLERQATIGEEQARAMREHGVPADADTIVRTFSEDIEQAYRMTWEEAEATRALLKDAGENVRIQPAPLDRGRS